jgi:hypothetical protein
MGVSISNARIYWADTLAELTALGTDDGLVTDSVGWVVASDNWYFASTVLASSSTWTATSYTLAAILSAGNATGGTAIITADGATPFDLVLTSGTSTSGGGDGGAIDLNAGDSDVGGTGGEVIIDGGAGGTTGIGGALIFTAGTGGSASGTGGAVTISGGAVGGSGGTGGAVLVESADGGPPGTLSLLAGSAGASSGSPGAEVDLTAGSGDGAGPGGALDFNAGAGGTSGAGGAVTIDAGTGGGAGPGGAFGINAGDGGLTGAGATLALTGGAGGGTSGPGGDITLTSGTVSDGSPGDIILTGSAGVGTDKPGGEISLLGGASTGTVDGADINLTPGTAGGSGADGSVVVTGDVEVSGKLTVSGLIDPTGMVFDEQTTVPGGAPGAAKGTVWVKSDAPNVLVFTDDVGTDTTIGSGIATTQVAGPAASYSGYTTSAVAWTSATWADVIGASAPATTFTNSDTTNISRSDSDFTFTKGGKYIAEVTISVSQGGSAGYIGLRLNGNTGGILAHHLSYERASQLGILVLNQIIDVADGEVVTLEYLASVAYASFGSTTLDGQVSRLVNVAFVSLAKTGDVTPRTGADVTASETVVIGTRTLYDPSGGTFTLTMPLSPLNGDRVSFKNVTIDTTSITIAGNGKTVEETGSYAQSSSVSVSGNGLGLDYEYSSAKTGWILV